MLNGKLIITLSCFLLSISGSVLAGGDAARGEKLAIDCSDCHGDDGLGDDETPSIAGMDQAELAKALLDYKTGAREDEDEMMIDYVTDLSEQDMADLAAYYATLPGG